MGFFKRLAGFFNRKKQEQEVEKQQRKWWQFWKRKEEEPEEPIPQAEGEGFQRVDASGLMDEVEKRRREQEEAAEKEANLQQKKTEREKARKTLNRRYGLDWSENDYNDFWDAFGDGDIARQYGSDVIIYARSEAASKGMEMDEFLNITRDVINEASGIGYNQQEMADRLYERIREWEAV